MNAKFLLLSVLVALAIAHVFADEEDQQTGDLQTEESRHGYYGYGKYHPYGYAYGYGYGYPYRPYGYYYKPYYRSYYYH